MVDQGNKSVCLGGTNTDPTLALIFRSGNPLTPSSHTVLRGSSLAPWMLAFSSILAGWEKEEPGLLLAFITLLRLAYYHYRAGRRKNPAYCLLH